ncbi:MAG: threonine--tRNA ligase [SAR202 cluster bacterium]|nr:threonine--tRNA ligase [SAR202 cluster bacterium]
MSQDLAELRKRIRHSTSHIMADVVTSMYPNVKLGIGPPTDDGFYYDFLMDTPIAQADFEKIEAAMREVMKKDFRFVYKEYPRAEALKLVKDQPLKTEIINDLPEGETISTYTHGRFEDLCAGPHIESTGKIPAFKLLNVAGAYWRGDEKRPMLQRVYGTAYESGEELEAHLKRVAEAERRDHRKLGVELGLFFFNPIAPSSPFFLPKGATLYNGHVTYVRDLYKRYGYQEVITPQMFDTELWKRSGHYANYKDNMYFSYVDEKEMGLKPMNCPAAAVLFGSSPHSYRELPIRYADFGRLHRYERSGVTHGLTRVRTFSQDDAHIFCRQDQIEQEINSFIAMVNETFNIFGFKDINVALSLRPDKRIGSDDLWDRAEGALASALTKQGIRFEPKPGEGAFYGPKIDFFVNDAIGRPWQLSTVQLDYNLAERFDLEYNAEDGTRQRPVVVHRAMLGSLERFLGVMIEHFAGAFPLWLAPVQAVVIPIADRHQEYANKVAAELAQAGIRNEVDSRNERMQAKIRDAQVQKAPYMLVVGDKEAQAEAAAVRLRSGENLGAVPVKEIIARMAAEIAEKKPSY